mgnify:CR=1 FL=1
MAKAKASKLKSLREVITVEILHEVDEMVIKQRAKTPHAKGKPYSAEWLWAFTRHPLTRQMFKDEVTNV